MKTGHFNLSTTSLGVAWRHCVKVCFCGRARLQSSRNGVDSTGLRREGLLLSYRTHSSGIAFDFSASSIAFQSAFERNPARTRICPNTIASTFTNGWLRVKRASRPESVAYPLMDRTTLGSCRVLHAHQPLLSIEVKNQLVCSAPAADPQV
jgi:hypothetical protein